MIILLAFSLFPLFADLGREYLWDDEGDTAVLASNIVKFGVPKAWDGRTFTDSDMGLRVNENLVMVSHPWVQYYLTAASFFLFGETAFAARLPFAIAGWLTIALTYLLVWRTTRDRRASITAAILLIVSVQFLIYSRQCRNYALNMFLGCLLLLIFFRLNNKWAALGFTAVAVLSFHTHPIALALIGAVGLLTIIHRPFFPFRKYFWMTVPVIAMCTLPWILWARSGYEVNTEVIKRATQFFPRFLQFLIECASVTPVLGIVALLVFIFWRRSNGVASARVEIFTTGQRTLLLTALIVILCYGIFTALTLSRASMWSFGLRYTSPVLPLMAALTGLLISNVSKSNTKVWFILVAIFAFTKLGRVTPWTFMAAPSESGWDADDLVGLHTPLRWQDKIFRTAQIGFVKDLLHENPGTVASVCEYLKKNAKPDDVLITNYSWEPIYFHTRLAQGLTILPFYKIYPVAVAHDLPRYVSTPENVRWIIWRTAWDGYRPPGWEDLYTALTQGGATVTGVASFKETAWENRENIHFRRFPGNDYKFHSYDHLPPAQLYRVDWPKKSTASVPSA